jgi:hypothetical protein
VLVVQIDNIDLFDPSIILHDLEFFGDAVAKKLKEKLI